MNTYLNLHGECPEYWAIEIRRYRDEYRQITAFSYRDGCTRFVVTEVGMGLTGNRPTPYELIAMGFDTGRGSLSIHGEPSI